MKTRNVLSVIVVVSAVLWVMAVAALMVVFA